MNAKIEMPLAPSIYGHIIDLGVAHSIAIYERNGVSWVAEFRDGHGEITYAGAWFRLNSAGLRYRHKRGASLQRSMPLTAEMLKKIERVHAETEARRERLLAGPGNVAATARRYWIKAISRVCGRAGTIGQTFG